MQDYVCGTDVSAFLRMKELRRRQKEIELIVGIDIGQESSQICYYDEQQRQPVSVSVVNSVDNRQKYQFGFMLSGANQDNLKNFFVRCLRCFQKRAKGRRTGFYLCHRQ